MQSDIMAKDLLIEFVTEELPPIGLEKTIGENFAINIYQEIKGFLAHNSNYEFFVSPRRFSCVISNVKPIEENQNILRKGPAVSNALINNEPTKALLGFLKSCNLANWRDLAQHEDGYFYAQQTITGKNLNAVLPNIIRQALKKLPIAKNMRWADHEYQFVRPVHNLAIIYGDTTLCEDSNIFGLTPNNYTIGHRILSTGKIRVNNPQSYVKQLEDQGKVIANFATRRNIIKRQLENKALELNLTVNEMPGLLDEVTALVEYPVVLDGIFAKEFLEVPQECLILSMAKNQKYFALLDKENKLSNHFLFVANIKSEKPEIIIKGNEKVLSARLGDAEFFYNMDKKQSLNKFGEKLSNVVYHNKLGTQSQRINRLQYIAGHIAPLMNVAPELAKHTALLLKADLTTEMVGEFPELQGVMGKYYALFHNETPIVANAIAEHYYPRFSGDILPTNNLSIIMSLSDKLESLVGIWGIGLIPSGDKDPFSLRRAALGIVRILLENQLNLRQILEFSYQSFTEYQLAKDTVDEVYQFILSRLFNYLTTEKGYKNNCVQSICTLKPNQFSGLYSLLDKLAVFAANANNLPLLAANKRIENILKKNINHNQIYHVEQNLLQENSEHKLYTLFIELEDQAENYALNNQWDNYFSLLSKFNQPITDFFDQIMVMVENEELRNNRLGLLQKMDRFFNKYCKLAELN